MEAVSALTTTALEKRYQAEVGDFLAAGRLINAMKTAAGSSSEVAAVSQVFAEKMKQLPGFFDSVNPLAAYQLKTFFEKWRAWDPANPGNAEIPQWSFEISTLVAVKTKAKADANRPNNADIIRVFFLALFLIGVWTEVYHVDCSPDGWIARIVTTHTYETILGALSRACRAVISGETGAAWFSANTWKRVITAELGPSDRLRNDTHLWRNDGAENAEGRGDTDRQLKGRGKKGGKGRKPSEIPCFFAIKNGSCTKQAEGKCNFNHTIRAEKDLGEADRARYQDWLKAGPAPKKKGDIKAELGETTSG